MPTLQRLRRSSSLLRSSFLPVILGPLVLGASFASANGPEIDYDGGSIIPIRSRDIRLVRESVHLYARLEDVSEPGRAECIYLLANSARKDHTIAMSFLGGWPPGTPPKVRVRVAGREVDTHLEHAERTRWASFGVEIPDSLPVWRLTVPARDSVVVDVEYQIRWSRGSDGSTSGRELRYHARPAALWAGTVREATVHLHLGEMITTLLRDRPINRDDYAVRLLLEPPDAEWTRDGLKWRRTHWEPDSDFRFGIEWDEPQDTGNTGD